MIELLPLWLALIAAAPPAATSSTTPGEATAVVVTLEPQELPEIEAMRGWFLAGGVPRPVLRVETGPAEVLVVRDPAVQAYLEHLAGAMLDRAILSAKKELPARKGDRPLGRGPHHVQVGDDSVLEVGATFRHPRTLTGGEVEKAREKLRRTCRLGDARVRFLSPMAAPVSQTSGQMGVFMQSRDWQPGPRGFLELVTKVSRLGFALRLHDAIWVAGHELHASGRRRAVITWLAGHSRDDSLRSAGEAASELERLLVPHLVWAFGSGPLADAWGGPLVPATDGVIHSPTALESLDAACDEVREALARQRVIWIEGDHAISDVRLAPEADGVRLAGGRP